MTAEKLIARGSVLLSISNTNPDGTGPMELLLDHDNQRGLPEIIKGITAQPTGTSIKTIVRLFANNGQDQQVAKNNFMIAEASIPAYTEGEIKPSIQLLAEVMRPFVLLPHHRIFATLLNAVANPILVLVE